MIHLCESCKNCIKDPNSSYGETTISKVCSVDGALIDIIIYNCEDYKKKGK